MQRKGNNFESNSKDKLLAFADKDMVELIIRNLISNAIKFCNSGDKVSVSATLKII